jgi:predicted DNA-binding transcriptional regulator YafY
MATKTLNDMVAVHEALLTTIGERGCLSRDDLAQRTKLPIYTVQRTINRIRAQAVKVGADDAVVYSRKFHGYYYRYAFSLFPAPLSSQEQHALCMMQAMVDAFANTPFAPAMRNALQTIRTMIPEHEQEFLTEDGPIFVYLHQPMVEDREVRCARFFKPLLQAITEHHSVDIVYENIKDGREIPVRIDPYLVFFGQGNWYIYSYHHEMKKMWDFALNRIKLMTPLDRCYTPLPEFDTLDKIRRKIRQRFSLFEGPLNDIAIRFSPERARWMQERLWHHSQRVEDRPDGSIILHLQCEGIPSLVRWILGFGGDATPLAPPELVREVAERAKKIVASVDNELTATPDTQ